MTPMESQTVWLSSSMSTSMYVLLRAFILCGGVVGSHFDAVQLDLRGDKSDR
jgi:hypothetical protein